MYKIILTTLLTFSMFASSNTIIKANSDKTYVQNDDTVIIEYAPLTNEELVNFIIEEVARKHGVSAEEVEFNLPISTYANSESYPDICDNPNSGCEFLGEERQTIDMGDARNQPRGGFVFEGNGGTIYYSEGSEQPVNISFSISIGGKVLSTSIGVALGSASASQIVGTGLIVDGNRPVKLGVTKIYDVLAYHVKTTIQGAVYEDDIAVPMFLQLKLYANYLD